MATYKVKRGDKIYEYEKKRNQYSNNSTEYNQEYYKQNKSRLRRQKIQKQIIDKLNEVLPKKKIQNNNA